VGCYGPKSVKLLGTTPAKVTQNTIVRSYVNTPHLLSGEDKRQRSDKIGGWSLDEHKANITEKPIVRPYVSASHLFNGG